MTQFKTSRVSAIVFSAALLHCSHKATPEPAAPSPSPETVAGTSSPPEEPQMTPASGSQASEAQAPQPTAPVAPAPPAESILDNEIFKMIELANAAEVDQAKVAQTKAKNPKVKNFAAKMIAHHGKAKEKGNKLSAKLGVQPAESAMSNQLRTDADAMLSSLKSEPAADFDRVYMNGQVEEHRKVLSTLDEKLIVNARDPELKALLQEMRTTVASHLEEAEKIQASL